MYVIERQKDQMAALKDGAILATCRIDQTAEVAYISEMAGSGDPGALRALIRATVDAVKGTYAILTVDARDPNALRLCRLYCHVAKLEYLAFKVNA